MKGSGRKAQRSVCTSGLLRGSGGSGTRQGSQGSACRGPLPRMVSIDLMPALADLKLHSSGKVREIYEWDDDLLMVASDRISIYDVVMPTPVPDKGKVLNRMSVFWFELTGDIVPNHFLSEDVPEEVADRAMRVRRLEMYPVECVVRGYLSGSGWKEYRESGAVCGIELPAGLLESDKLPEPIFTPATKAEIGDHDENVDFERAAEIVGDRALMEELRRVSIEVYQPRRRARRRARDHPRRHQVRVRPPRRRRGRPRRRGPDPRLLALLARRPLRARPTPPSFDKQYVRDWADEAGWDHTPPAPELPPDVVEQTRAKYVEAYERITETALLVMKARVLIRPKEGILDPQGKAVERALPALGFEGVEHVRVGRMVELEAEDPGAAGGALREAARQPADRGLRDPDPVIWGVLQFPGSCDERDALHACSLSGEARLIWHEEPRPRRRRRRSSSPAASPTATTCGPARSPASRRRWRRSPSSPRPAARCSASATASRSSARPGLLPGALLLNENLRFVCRQLDLVIEAPSRRIHRDRRRAALDPGQARGRALLRAGGDARRARGERAGRLPLRAGAEPERVGARHRRGHQRGRQRARPDAAPRARRRPADRLDRRPAGLRGDGRGFAA